MVWLETCTVHGRQNPRGQDTGQSRWRRKSYLIVGRVRTRSKVRSAKSRGYVYFHFFSRSDSSKVHSDSTNTAWTCLNMFTATTDRDCGLGTCTIWHDILPRGVDKAAKPFTSMDPRSGDLFVGWLDYDLALSEVSLERLWIPK